MPNQMFTPETRERLREALVARAHSDDRIVAAAVVGSASVGREDRWSDIDLALGLAETAEMSEVMADWTEEMYRDHGTVHHLDVWRGPSCVRVFLLADTLQVDIAFRPPPDFRATSSTFRLLFGEAGDRPPAPPPDADELIGLGWVYALHVRSSLERGRVWQAEWMLSRVREQVLALACLRHGLPTDEGRGIDELSPDVTKSLTDILPRSLDVAELRRAFRVTGDRLIEEIAQADYDLLERLREPLRTLVYSPAD
jgi:hypothetical protein